MRNTQIPKILQYIKIHEKCKVDSVKHKIRSKDHVKFLHDSAQRAFNDLQMSPHPLDSIETEIDNYDYCRNQNKIHGRISTEWNDEERTEDEQRAED